MTGVDHSSEIGGEQLERREAVPDPLELLQRFVSELRTGKPSPLRRMELVARELRVISTLDPSLSYTLGQAEYLDKIEKLLEGLLAEAEQLVEGVNEPEIAPSILGKAALGHSGQKTQ